MEETTALLTEDQVKMLRELGAIFMPRVLQKAKKRWPDFSSTSRFAHYTTAESAMKIIESKRLWMRNAMCMTDYREVNHGFDMIKTAFHSNVNETQTRMQLFTGVLDSCAPGVATEAIAQFDKVLNQIRLYTHIASLSEHGGNGDDEIEDKYGRLSMWREFGDSPGRVAIIVSLPWFSESGQKLRISFSPVGYSTADQVVKELDGVIQNIRDHATYLSQDHLRPWIQGIVYSMLLSSVTCLKHCGFHEEREWRVVHGSWPLTSPHMKPSVVTVGGIPQHIYELPLEAAVAPDLDFARIFDRLIIGPTQYPLSIKNAFIEKLGAAGVSNPADKIIISDIPIRT